MFEDREDESVVVPEFDDVHVHWICARGHTHHSHKLDLILPHGLGIFGHIEFKKDGCSIAEIMIDLHHLYNKFFALKKNNICISVIEYNCSDDIVRSLLNYVAEYF